jgi:membrane protease YdiL (CAAX protease family)
MAMIESDVVPPGPRRPPIWGAWATAGFGLAVIFIFVIIQSLVAVAFVVAEIVKEPAIDIERLVDQLINNGDLLTTATIASAVICGGLIFVFVKVRRGASFAEYLAFKSLSKRSVVAILAITVIFIVFSSLFNLFLERPADSDFMTGAYGNVTSLPLLWFAIVVFAPLFEELFIRGFLFIGFARSRLGPAGAVILTTLVWALLHIQYGLYEITLIFVLGIILGIVRHRAGSLWAPIIIHALNNLVAMILVQLTFGVIPV